MSSSKSAAPTFGGPPVAGLPGPVPRRRAIARRAALVIAALSLAACDITGPTGTPDPEPQPEDPSSPTRERTPMYALEDVTLLSGGTGVLVSESYDGLILTPAEGEDPEAPRRYTDFFVRVDGMEVDAVRLDERRIAFDVPALPEGTVGIDLFSRLGEGSVSAQVLGLLASGRTPCAGASDLVFTPVGFEVYVQVPCFPRDSSTIVDRGIARLLPDIVQREFTPVPGSIAPGDDPGLREDRIAVGPSSVESHFVGPYPTPASDPPMIWRWEGGQTPGPVGQIDCGLTAAFTSGAVAESGDGTCVALDFDRDVLLRSGAEIAAARGASSIVGSADGWLALRGGTTLIVLDATGTVAFEGEAGASDIAALRFSPDGQELFVGRASRIDVVDRETGAVLRSAALSGMPLALAVTEERLYAAIDEPEPSSPGASHRLVVARLDPGTLALERKVAVSPALAADPTGWPDQGESPLLLEDATGTRVLLVTQVSATSGVHVHAVGGL